VNFFFLNFFSFFLCEEIKLCYFSENSHTWGLPWYLSYYPQGCDCFVNSKYQPWPVIELVLIRNSLQNQFFDIKNLAITSKNLSRLGEITLGIK
jgi:hypothetical protein